MDRDESAVPRDRYVDLLRVVGVAVVVLCHWAVYNVSWEGDVIEGVNALSVIPAIRPVTWVVQVMPLMFFVGGFSNARALQARGGSTVAFLRDRLVRLLLPTTIFIAVWLVLGLVQAAADLPDPDLLRRAADVAALPFWFLGIYLVAVGLAPGTLWLHRRFGWWVPGLLAMGALAVDVVSRGLGHENLGGINYALVWLFAHQTGYFYADGRLPRMGRGGAAILIGVGLAGMVTLITWFGYPVSMVEVPGQETSNTAPPSVGLIFLTVWLVGLVAAFREPATRWLRDDRRYRRVARLNGVVLTAYLWHVTAITAAVSILYPLGFPQPEIGTGAWWALRPGFVLAMVPLLVILLLAFARFEIHPHTGGVLRPLGRARAAGVVLGIFSIAICLLGFGMTGFIELADADGSAILMFRFNPLQNVLHGVVGAFVTWSALRGARRLAEPVLLVGGAAYLLMASYALRIESDHLGMNRATAVAHLVVGSVAVAAAVLLAVGSGVRRVLGGPSSEPGKSAGAIGTEDPEKGAAGGRHNVGNSGRGG